VNDLAQVQDRWTATATDDELIGTVGGRHAFDEDAVLTPIFAALRRGGWRRRQHEPSAATRAAALDPVDEFRRDPLTAPIPVQVLVPSPSRSVEHYPEPTRQRANVAAHATEGRVDTVDRGRHHRRRETVGHYR
jgi:hypothetical protein